VTRPLSSPIRPDGRLRLRVDLPDDVVNVAERVAAELGTDRELVLGDLAAAALPGLLAELAEETVARSARERLLRTSFENAEMPPALAEGTPNPKALQPQVTASIARGDLDPEDAPGAEV
jgi:hypothetical protein